MKTYHEAGDTDQQCEVRCVRCGCLLAPANTWTTDEGREMRVPAAFRPAKGQIVCLTGEGPCFGRFTAGPEAQPTCAVSAMQGAA